MSSIDIIIPVLNDLRVIDTIASVRRFDRNNCVRIIVMCGSSSQDFRQRLIPFLTKKDVMYGEKDSGLFDALNLGLDICTADIVGWLGADDIFSGHVSAMDVVSEFRTHDCDLLIYSTDYHIAGRVTRRLSASLSHGLLVPLGFHNPHFSTFISSRIYRNYRFPIDPTARNQFADIKFFANLIPFYKVRRCNKVCTLMTEGGTGSGSPSAVLHNVHQRFKFYRTRFGPLSGVCAPIICLGWKLFARSLAFVFRKHYLLPQNYVHN